MRTGKVWEVGKTFDAKQISEFLYRPQADDASYPGSNVEYDLVVIHGENRKGRVVDQPCFWVAGNYYLERPGRLASFYTNCAAGSTLTKTSRLLDTDFQREDTSKRHQFRYELDRYAK